MIWSSTRSSFTSKINLQAKAAKAAKEADKLKEKDTW